MNSIEKGICLSLELDSNCYYRKLIKESFIKMFLELIVEQNKTKIESMTTKDKLILGEYIEDVTKEVVKEPNKYPRGIQKQLHDICRNLYGEEVKYPIEWFVDSDNIDLKPEEYKWKILKNTKN